MLDLLEGLRCISLNGFMHCNIKPSNILVSQDGTAKITDLALMRKINQ
jgi:serine/threonine protein kinase